MGCKKVVILGSTGSIGINALKVIERHPGQFRVIALSAYTNVALLERQIKKFKPRYVALRPKGISQLKRHINTRATRIYNVDEDLDKLVTLESADIIIVAMRGSAALKPFLSALRAGKIVAPANKEALVIAGNYLMREAKRCHAKIIPIDSEQSAIFQCLEGRNREDVHKIHLTASGGALLNVAKSRFDRLAVNQILNHPRWKMGRKITVDSATLMNKGFEVIESMVLFQLAVGQIDVIIHPEAIIHSMVEFTDGSIIAQLSITDMRLPIQYALTYPRRLDTGLHRLEFSKLKTLNFQKPDMSKFPSLALAIEAGTKGGTMPSVLNAADEEAVDAFLQKQIKLTQIYKCVERVIHRHRVVQNPNLADIMAADAWARDESRKVIARLTK